LKVEWDRHPRGQLARRLEDFGAWSGFGNDVLGDSHAARDLAQTFACILMRR